MIPRDDELVQQVLDGTAGPARFREFQQRLRQEPALVALYRDHLLLHHSLCEEFEGRRAIGRPLPKPAAPRRNRVAALAAAAAVVLLAGLGCWLLLRPAATGPAAMTFSADARWQGVGTRTLTPPTAALPRGASLRLDRGTARVMLPGGASGIITAPAALAYPAAHTLRLDTGRGRFLHPPGAPPLAVETPAFTAVDLGTEFAVLARPDRTGELHVFEGRVELRQAGQPQPPVLVAGQAAAVPAAGPPVRIAARPAEFPAKLPTTRALATTRFDTPAATLAPWQVTSGTPRLDHGTLQGTSFEAFLDLPGVAPDMFHPLLLATLETAAATDDTFHTPGWAGLSLFHQDRELVFFGDSFGPEPTWSLDVKQSLPPVLPATPVTGPRTVTLRYDSRSGETTLHLGPSATGEPFVRASLPARLQFDRLRLAASPGATLAARAVDVRASD